MMPESWAARMSLRSSRWAGTVWAAGIRMAMASPTVLPELYDRAVSDLADERRDGHWRFVCQSEADVRLEGSGSGGHEQRQHDWADAGLVLERGNGHRKRLSERQRRCRMDRSGAEVTASRRNRDPFATH